jgi:hypothetical protein
VAAGEEADAELLDDLVLTDDDTAEFGAELVIDGAERIDSGDVIRR